MRLEDQCEKLGIELEDIELEYSGRPEDAALKYFERQAYIGSSNEGITMQTVLKALMLNKLAEVNTFQDRSDACSRYLEAQFAIHKEISSEIISTISSVQFDEFRKNMKEILSQSFINNEYPELSLIVCEAIYHAIDKKEYTLLAEKFAEDSYTYRSGWPDLTLIKSNDLQFVEVKTTDKLHKSQLSTIPMLKEVLPYKISVLRVRNTKT